MAVKDIKYTEADKKSLFDNICESIVSGNSLRISLINVNVNPFTFYSWMEKDKEFAKNYARATSIRADMMFEDLFDVADKEPSTTETKFGSAVDSGDVQNKRLMIDTRKWALAKMNPKKYGSVPDEKDDSDSEIIIKIIE
jgi:hypothetical protein